MQKWFLGIATSIGVGLVIWWLTGDYLARPDIRIVDQRDSGCSPLVVTATIFNSGNAIAENCYLRVEYYVDDGGMFPTSYADLTRMERFDVGLGSKDFVPPNGQKELTAKFYPPKDYRCDLPAVLEDYTDVVLWQGLIVEYDASSTRAVNGQAIIYAPPSAR